MLKTNLTIAQEELLKKERAWLGDLQIILGKLGATDEEQTTLKHSTQQLDELFMLVVVGEFNAGKSSLINALLGQVVLKEGVTPTTAQINLLKYGDYGSRQVKNANLHVIHEPLDLLSYLNIVDTPGTNAIVQGHQEITEEFVPRSDLVLFITSADRPFTESERVFLNKIKAWGKKVVIIINKIDIFQSEADKEHVIQFVTANATSLLGLGNDATVFAVSGKQALEAKLTSDDELRRKSGFAVLESFIQQTLDQGERLRLKLLNPLGIGDRLLNQYSDIVDNRLILLRDDFDTLENLERQQKLYEEDMTRNFKYRVSDLENILHDMERRGNTYFDETMRMTRVLELANKSAMQRGFEQQVIADTPQLIEEKVTEMIDWLVNADLQQWQAVTDYLQDRKQQYQNRIIGDVGAGFRYDRNHLLETVGRSAQRIVDGYDRTQEANKIGENARLAVAGTAVAQIGALGTIATALATAAVDITGGFVAAGVLGTLGLFVIPSRKHAAKVELASRIADLRVHLTATIQSQFDKELKRSLQRIHEATAPYTRFVRSEKEKLEGMLTELEAAKEQQTKLRLEIEAM